MTLVFMDIQIGKSEPKQMVFQLFSDDLPKTSENFRLLCTGEKSTPKQKLSFKGNRFHRMVKNFMAQGGDITLGDGRGGVSVYGPTFKDESFKFSPDFTGQLVMVNNGPNSNGSQFLITYVPCPWLHRKNVVFGKVAMGLDIITEMEAGNYDKIYCSVSSDNGISRVMVKIVNCGMYVPPPEVQIIQILEEPKKKVENEYNDENQEDGEEDK